jgi:hypothetical protein
MICATESRPAAERQVKTTSIPVDLIHEASTTFAITVLPVATRGAAEQQGAA